MQMVLVLSVAVLSPGLGLLLLLWLAHLEDTLPRDVLRAARTPAPPPILAIPVRTPTTRQAVTVPEQRTVPEVEVTAAPAAQPI